uniref:Uncharacterized protein n=1 Tax=Anguilla anguilla TaxID=7936 RepID=A0A0E9QU79_ANGAN
MLPSAGRIGTVEGTGLAILFSVAGGRLQLIRKRQKSLL